MDWTKLAAEAWAWLGSNDEQLIVVFTGALFCVTASLAKYTKKLWASTRALVKSGEDALAPHLVPRVVGNQLFEGFGPEHRIYDDAQVSLRPSLTFVMENFGRSPAIVRSIAYDLILEEIDRGAVVPPVPSDMAGFVISPVIPADGGRSLAIQAALATGITTTLRAYLEALNSLPGKRFYLRAIVRFMDVFGNEFEQQFVMKGMPPKAEHFEMKTAKKIRLGRTEGALSEGSIGNAEPH